MSLSISPFHSFYISHRNPVYQTPYYTTVNYHQSLTDFELEVVVRVLIDDFHLIHHCQNKLHQYLHVMTHRATCFLNKKKDFTP